MGPYGSVGAHIKTGRSHIAQDHFKTPPDPKMAHKNSKMTKKIRKKVKNLLELAKFQSHMLNLPFRRFEPEPPNLFFSEPPVFWGSGGV